ncbi:hypothetical protein [Paenibacillus agricola]|uniref:hypothetical protein n=1 Tax=Paenibacillus agricola TaxID=2716264 RepID=UPI001A9F7050|nr:hypothetical protein [Paenibacillus agricola]
MLYKVMGAAYNAKQLNWDWMQTVVDKTLTASGLSIRHLQDRYQAVLKSTLGSNKRLLN